MSIAQGPALIVVEVTGL